MAAAGDEILGRPDLAADPRFAHNADRVARRDELDAVIAAWARTLTFAAASAAAEAAGIGWARFNTPIEVLDHPELAARDRWVATAAPGTEFQSLRPPADSAGWDWQPGAVPALGDHTAAIRRSSRDRAGSCKTRSRNSVQFVTQVSALSYSRVRFSP